MKLQMHKAKSMLLFFTMLLPHSLFSTMKEPEERQVSDDVFTVITINPALSSNQVRAEVGRIFQTFQPETEGVTETLIIDGSGSTMEIPATSPLVLPAGVNIKLLNMTVVMHSDRPFIFNNTSTVTFVDATIVAANEEVFAKLLISTNWLCGEPDINNEDDGTITASAPQPL